MFLTLVSSFISLLSMRVSYRDTFLLFLRIATRAINSLKNQASLTITMTGRDLANKNVTKNTLHDKLTGF